MRYAFIEEQRGSWAIKLIAEVLAVSTSGFYSWLKRPKSRRTEEDEMLTEQIIMFHCGSRCTYGSPRIHKDLQAAGHQVGHKRVARLMRAAGIRGKTKRKFKTTTNAKHNRPKAENLVRQNFAVAVPDTLWASDITYISTSEGWLYLAVTLDLFSRKVIGWAFSDRLTDDLSLAALEMATRQRPASARLIHHSDQGVQYASSAFRSELSANVSSRACRARATVMTMRLLKVSSPRSKLRRSRVFVTRPAGKPKPASSATWRAFTIPGVDTRPWATFRPMTLKGYTSLESLNYDSVKTGEYHLSKESAEA